MVYCVCARSCLPLTPSPCQPLPSSEQHCRALAGARRWRVHCGLGGGAQDRVVLGQLPDEELRQRAYVSVGKSARPDDVCVAGTEAHCTTTRLVSLASVPPHPRAGASPRPCCTSEADVEGHCSI